MTYGHLLDKALFIGSALTKAIKSGALTLHVRTTVSLERRFQHRTSGLTSGGVWLCSLIHSEAFPSNPAKPISYDNEWGRK